MSGLAAMQANIVAALEVRGPMRPRDMVKMLGNADGSQVYNAFTRLRSIGKITKIGSCYALPGQGVPYGSAWPIGTKHRKSDDRANGAAVTSGAQNTAAERGAALIVLATDLQAAMDRYIVSVCDSEVLQPLRAARDAARRAADRLAGRGA